MLKLHHIGCLVDNIENSIKIYQPLFAYNEVSEKIYVSSQKTFVCFVKVSDNIFLELIEPEDEDSVVYKLKKKGVSYYHTAYYVDDFENAEDFFLKQNFKQINTFYSEAFKDKRCAFFVSPDMHLIEIIEEV